MWITSMGNHGAAGGISEHRRSSFIRLWLLVIEMTSHYLNQWWLINTVRCHYTMVNFLTNIHKRHPIAWPLGQGMRCLLWIQHLIDILPQLLNEVNRGYSGFTLSMCLSVHLSICGQYHVCSVSSTILAGFFAYSHILSTNFRKCVPCLV